MRFFRYLLFPFALLYGFITWMRNNFYDWGIFRSRKFEIPTISVGNLSVGGTGKTPHIEYLINMLKEKHQISTLSRGYGRKTKGFLLANRESTTKEIGDEPKQFAMKFLEQIKVAVCEKRVKGVKTLLQKFPDLEAVLLDDAFQHRAIKPGLSIILTDFAKLYSKNFVLPTGTLREFSSGAKRADIVVVSKSPKILSPLERRRILNEIKTYPHQKLFFSYIKYGSLEPMPFLNFEPDLCKTTVIILFTGIANPSPLEEHLKLKCDELKVIRFPDHHNYTVKDLEKIRHEYKETFQRCKIVVTTEKDLMRLESKELQDVFKDIPAYYVPIEIKFHENETGKSFDELIYNYVEKNIPKKNE